MSPKRKVTRYPRPASAAARTSTAANGPVARRRQRRGLAIGLFALAPVIAISHMLEHLGSFQVMSPAAEDIFIGWPMALVLLIIGGILWG